jgi:Carboxypeptidase regulatory-like domain/Tissue inhibitor of metalloproteinase
MRWLLITIGAFSLAVLSAGNALACSCAARLPCQAYGDASAVFIGTVIDSRMINVTQSNYKRNKRVVRLSVDSAFRGIKGSDVEVMTGMGGGDCGFEFVPAGQYLVYASEYEGKLSTSICSRTRSISRATEDLNYIRGLATAKAGATISGKVVRNRQNQNGGYENQVMAHIRVTIEGPAKRETKTDDKGQFSVEGLPAGPYMVKVSLPVGLALTGPSEQKVTVTDRGCAVVEFWFEPAVTVGIQNRER